jgi:hypothetical protein
MISRLNIQVTGQGPWFLQFQDIPTFPGVDGLVFPPAVLQTDLSPAIVNRDCLLCFKIRVGHNRLLRHPSAQAQCNSTLLANMEFPARVKRQKGNDPHTETVKGALEIRTEERNIEFGSKTTEKQYWFQSV